MKITQTKVSVALGTVGAAATTVAACAACCISIPVIGPLLAWAGLTTIGGASTGWYLPAFGAFMMGASIWMNIAWRMSKKRMRAPFAARGMTAEIRANWDSSRGMALQLVRR